MVPYSLPYSCPYLSCKPTTTTKKHNSKTKQDTLQFFHSYWKELIVEISLTLIDIWYLDMQVWLDMTQEIFLPPFPNPPPPPPPKQQQKSKQRNKQHKKTKKQNKHKTTTGNAACQVFISYLQVVWLLSTFNIILMERGN